MTSRSAPSPAAADRRVVLISCYELGHEPLGLGVPAGVLARSGIRPRLLDLAVEPMDEETIVNANFVGISVPMHTALRLGVRAARRIREMNPSAHICFYGMYAGLNEATLRSIADSVLGAEFEVPLVSLVTRVLTGSRDAVDAVEPARSPNRDARLLPDRSGLQHPDRYVKLALSGERLRVGYTTTTRGCKHLCRHCPLPPVYGGSFYAIPVEDVAADIGSLVERGARHITFGDPDFLNGPTHARRVARALHNAHPGVTFDYTAKVEHLRRNPDLVEELQSLGNLFVVSAVESVNDAVLEKLDKGHTRDDVVAVLRDFARIGLTLRPTFVPFTPWETLASYVELLDLVEGEGVVESVDPVQYSVRLLLPPGSLLLEDPSVARVVGELDRGRFTWNWSHPDPRMDALHRDVERVARDAADTGAGATATFRVIRDLARETAGLPPASNGVARVRGLASSGAPPRLTEAWFC